MSSSRSDVVTKCFRLSVGSYPYFLLVSMESALPLDVSRMFQDILRKFQGCFKEVSRTFQESFKGVSRKFQDCFKKLPRMFQDSFKGVSRKFKGCFKEVSRVF